VWGCGLMARAKPERRCKRLGLAPVWYDEGRVMEIGFQAARRGVDGKPHGGYAHAGCANLRGLRVAHDADWILLIPIRARKNELIYTARIELPRRFEVLAALAEEFDRLARETDQLAYWKRQRVQELKERDDG
jgi:hypothetical protein